MTISKGWLNRFKRTVIFALSCWYIGGALATNLNLATAPLYVKQDEPPMVMLVMGRDHTLFYEAYNDASDLNGDGTLNTKYSPSEVDYSGYFDSYKCYKTNNNKTKFIPVSTTSNKKCTGSNAPWSGDFLNYLTMARIDILRQVLYGGYRVVDNTNTFLQRTFIPQDAHSWGKAYTSESVDGYKLKEYSPYDPPSTNKKHFFGTATFYAAGLPELRVKLNQNGEIWNWASTERPVLAGDVGGSVNDSYVVKVKVCVPGLLEANCKAYGDEESPTYKPTGLLHTYGEDDSMDFGLITGGYNSNLSGGILRKVVSSFTNEVNETNGKFTDYNGIVSTINKLTIYGFAYSTYHSSKDGAGDYHINDEKHHYGDSNCGWITDRAINNGECHSWGSPIGEMLYESLRYFNGAESPSGSYVPTSASVDNALGLPAPDWDNPFEDRAYCAPPHNLVISDVNPSYDSDQLPGAQSSFAKEYQGSTLNGFSVSNLLQEISTDEALSGKYYIGESTDDMSNTTNAPTPKTVSNLANIRGLSPQEPTKQGSYSSAAVAYYGAKTDLFPNNSGHRSIKTSVVAISSPLPEIEIKVGDKTITMVPYAKSVRDYGINPDQGEFQPTNTIVDYYVESQTETTGKFRINFEDVEQGADHDMDMIVEYSYEVAELCPSPDDDYCSNKRQGVKLTLNSTYAQGGIDQHAGYVISGTEDDGIYLDVRDKNGNVGLYYLDTPSQDSKPYPNNVRYGTQAEVLAACDFNNSGAVDWDDVNNNAATMDEECTPMPLQRTRHFFPSAVPASLLPSPLWYAAKWGGFKEDDTNANYKPDLDDEWDADGDGLPDAYFPVTNAGELGAQLKKAFDDLSNSNLSSNPPVFNNIFLDTGTLRYQTFFDSEYWSGDLLAFEAEGDSFSDSEKWSVADKLAARSSNTRDIFSRNNETGNTFVFRPPASESALGGSNDSFSFGQINALLDGFSGSNEEKMAYLSLVINYLRGDRSNEDSEAEPIMRERKSPLGDIVNSTPYLVSPETGHDVDRSVLIFGANDGMVHVIDANAGDEIMAYIPSQVYGSSTPENIAKLQNLSDLTYEHYYYVDGGISAYSDDSSTIAVGRLGTGFKGLYAIDVTNMSSPTAANMKWEITAEDSFSGIGYSNSAPTIAKLANGKTGVIFENGYNSSNSTGQLFIADLATGDKIATLSVGTQVDPTGANRPNALATPAVVDLNADGIADRIYAGDLFGNMWAFNITSLESSQWDVAHKISGVKKPLFTAISPDKIADVMNYDSQAITSRPSVGMHPNGLPNDEGVLVAFGTGKFIEDGDRTINDHPTQSFYVIWDEFNLAPVTDTRRQVIVGTEYSQQYSHLLRQAIIEEDSENRKVTENIIDWTAHKGWYIDLVNTQDGNTDNLGERQVTESLLLANKVAFTTLIPSDDSCSAGGTGWYMALDLHTGRTWNNGTDGNTNPENPNDTINNDTSHQRLEGGIPSSPRVVIDTGGGGGDDDDDDGTPASGNNPIIEKNCVTMSNGQIFCHDDESSAAGRLSWRQLF